MLNKKEKDYAKKTKITQKTLEKIKTLLDCEDWLEIFESNPYQLIEFSGFGFHRCDELAKKIGFDMRSPKRVKAYIVVCIENSTKGDSILNVFEVMSNIERDLDVDKDLVINSVFAYDGDYVLLDHNYRSLTKKEIKNSIPTYITTTEWYNAEKFLFNYMKRLAKQTTPKADINIIEKLLDKNSTLNPKQKYTVEHILDKNVNLLIGSSGSGKSYVTRIILDLLDWHKYSYTLLAPTGIASFNLSEKTGRNTSTIHRRYFAKKEITTDYVIIDEIGMCGYTHFNMLKELIINKSKTKILFIGDKYQLPSISAGDFLASMMNLIKNNKVDGNIFELTQVMRAKDDKDITTICNMFCGDSKFYRDTMDKRLNGVKFLDRKEDLFKQIEDIITNNKWTWEDTAIIMPQRKGNLGCDSFNKFIQSKNENSILYQDKFKTYKEHDILMHIKNNSKLNIYNGEMVELLGFTGSEYIARKLYDNTEVIYSEEELLTETTLGYSFTVHKSQGCTIKNVIFVGIKEFTYMLSRNLIYVGLSRASENLVVICDKDTMVRGSYKNLTDKRRTFLNLLSGV